MYLNFTVKWPNIVGRIMPNIEKILRNQELISKELCSLKAEVNDLETLFHKLKNCCGETPSKNLAEENLYLEKQIDFTKQELIRLEVARGVQQIPLPKRDLTHSSEVCKASAVNESQSKDAAQPLDSEKVDTKPVVKEVKKKDKAVKESKKDATNKPDSNKGEYAKEGPVDVSRLDMRIGKIVEVKKHPDADSLYVEQIDIGKDKPITVVSGLVKHVPVEEMQDRMVVLLCNLKPAKMRGITSEAMVMCASTPDKVEILKPPAGAVPGDIVHVQGFPPNPDPVLNPKKKIFETVAPDLKTDGSCQATYKGHVWTVPEKGTVTTSTLSGVNIK